MHGHNVGRTFAASPRRAHLAVAHAVESTTAGALSIYVSVFVYVYMHICIYICIYIIDTDLGNTQSAPRGGERATVC